MKVRLNNFTINYTERGLPQGSPIIFIHGFPFNHSMWDPQMMALPNHYRAITYDIRGHGLSEIGDGQYTIDLFVEDLIALLDHLVIDRTTVCGLSMGGYIALRALERYPERFNALILSNTRAESDSNETKVKRFATFKMIKERGVSVFAEQFVQSIFSDDTKSKNDALVNSFTRLIQTNSPLGICGTILALASRTDLLAGLSQIAIPTLILVGEHDTLTPVSASRTMREHIQRSTLKVISHAAHISNLENPIEFNKVLVEFLNEVP
ncbi:MAG: alpha/beta fold hydrolase [bacterium]